MNKLLLAITLQVAAVSGAKTYDVINSNHQSASTVRRRLGPNLLDWFRTNPKVNRCWGEVETDDVTGDVKPAVACEFVAPAHYNSTSDIKRGPCEQFIEPSCDEKVNDACVGPFITSGKMRTVAYPEIHPDELDKDEFNHTYCARTDVYQYDEETGEQVSFLHATRELLITFRGGSDENDESYLVETEPDSEKGIAMGTVVGSVVGALIVISIVAFFLVKRKRGGLKIHQVADADSGNADDEKAKEDEDGGLELEIV